MPGHRRHRMQRRHIGKNSTPSTKDKASGGIACQPRPLPKTTATNHTEKWDDDMHKVKKTNEHVQVRLFGGVCEEGVPCM
jgi:hypothetical protein